MQKKSETKEVGFNKEKQGRQLSQSEQNTQRRRSRKWQIMQQVFEEVKDSDKFKSRVRKGIPPDMRTEIWPQLAEISNIKNLHSNKIFSNYIDREIPESYKNQYRTILDDVPRTNFKNLQISDQEAKENLRVTLKCFLLAYPQIGYLQGLNYICGFLQTRFDRETSFWFIVSMMFKYKMEYIFSDILNIQRPISIFDSLVARYFPKISKNIKIAGLDLQMVCTSWFLTCYLTVLPVETVFSIFDIFLNEPEKILYRIGLAIFKSRQKRLIAAGSRFDKLMYCFKQLDSDPEMLPEKLIKNALSFTFSRDSLEKLENQYDEQFPMKTMRKQEIYQLDDSRSIPDERD